MNHLNLKKKIILSSILAVVIPLLMILSIWAGYTRLGGGAYIKPISRASGGDLLTEAMNILYTYEAELSDMTWDVMAIPGDEEADILVTPEKERVMELMHLGYRLQVESPTGISFSNLEEDDLQILAETGARNDGAIIWSGDSLVIQDSFSLSGEDYYMTAVYKGSRADQGVWMSLLPMYMVSPVMVLIFLVAAVLYIALTAALTARWITRSVLKPLDALKTGVDRIAEGDLDYRIPYAGADEFGDVCAEFDYMRRQMKEAKNLQRRYEEERRDLLRGISHDLRSPLTSIKGYAMGLKDGIASTEEMRQRYYIAILSRTEDLEKLTETLSLLVKLEHDNSILHLEKVCLDEYIRQLLSERDSWLVEQNIDVDYQTVNPGIEVFLDIREMQRVFMNLFENTVKYRTGSHSTVKISVLMRNDEAEIRISDDGPGVSARHLNHLFDSFYRVDEARTNPEKGSGLGLAVVKRIIEGQNGRIFACSEGGLCIVMILPLVKGMNNNEENFDR